MHHVTIWRKISAAHYVGSDLRNSKTYPWSQILIYQSSLKCKNSPNVNSKSFVMLCSILFVYLLFCPPLNHVSSTCNPEQISNLQTSHFLLLCPLVAVYFGPSQGLSDILPGWILNGNTTSRGESYLHNRQIHKLGRLQNLTSRY